MKEPWWKRSVVYQIYPKSFKDTTGNGEGDINGIIEKLDYIKALGVDVIWLTPIYLSPQKDNGYDISDYYQIDPRYGTMADFDRLLHEAHARNLKVIMDNVVNHTSTEHEWFKKASQSKEAPEHDYYIWKSSKADGLPTNWESKFGGEAWAYNEATDEYYLHLFDVTQADLNWENKELRSKVYEMMQFWLDKGIDGFRLDVINLISKDQHFPDDHHGDGRRFYTDGPRAHEFLNEMNEKVFSKYDVLTVGEMSSTTIDHCLRYTDPDNNELSMTFNFHHLKADYPNGEKWSLAPLDFAQLKNLFKDWQTCMQKGGGWNALFWCNHDQPRIVSRYGNDGKYRTESAKMLATVLHLMQGTPYIFQGEELGMTNPHYKRIEDYRDVESLNMYNLLKEQGKSEPDILKILAERSRDNSRTPMQWSAGSNSGFTTGTPWISIADNFQKINAEKEMNDPHSIFHYYQHLIKLRKEWDIITYGTFEMLLEDDPSVFAYKRTWENQTLTVVCNFFDSEAEVNLNSVLNGEETVLISNYPVEKLSGGKLALRPYETKVYVRN